MEEIQTIIKIYTTETLKLIKTDVSTYQLSASSTLSL